MCFVLKLPVPFHTASVEPAKQNDNNENARSQLDGCHNADWMHVQKASSRVEKGIIVKMRPSQ